MRLSAAILFTLLPAIIATPIREGALAPLSVAPNADLVDNSYIVVFKKGISRDQIALHLNAITVASATSVSFTK